MSGQTPVQIVLQAVVSRTGYLIPYRRQFF